MIRQKLVRDFKILFAAHHYAYISKDTDEIASVVNVSRRNIKSLIDTPEFLDALSFWSCKENVVGDLVIRFGDETYLVCIRHGRFTLTRKSTADDVVNVYDKRLLVCL